MHVRLVDSGLMIEGPGVLLIIPDEEFDPIFWLMLIECVREGVVYG